MATTPTKNIKNFPVATSFNAGDVAHISQNGVDKQIDSTTILEQINGGQPFRPNILTESGVSRTLTGADKAGYISCTNPLTTTITVSSEASSNWRMGEVITIHKEATGDVIFQGASGVTVNPSVSGLTLSEIGQVGTLLYKGNDVWDFLTGGSASTSIQGAITFGTVASLKAGATIEGATIIDWGSYLGWKVSTVFNNTTSNAGGARYIITNVNPSNLSTLVSGIWVGSNHDLGGGYYASIIHEQTRKFTQYGGIVGGTHAANGAINFAAFSAMINRPTYGYSVECSMPAGSIYFGSNQIYWGHYRKIVGAGREATTLRFEFNGVDENAILIDQFNYISDLGILNDGTNITTSGGLVSYVSDGSGANGAANCVFKDVKIKDFGFNITASKVSGSRLTFSNVFNTRFEGVRCYGGLNNVLLGAGVNNTTFIDCWFVDSRSRNIRGSEWLSATFIGCADEGTIAGAFSVYLTLCQNTRFINPYHEPLRGYFIDTCPGMVIDRPQINGFSPVTSGTGSNTVVSSFWTLNAGYAFSTPSPVFLYAPVFNTTANLSAYTAWASGVSQAPIRLVGVPTDRSGTLPAISESYLLSDNPANKIPDNSVASGPVGTNLARQVNFSQFSLGAGSSVNIATTTGSGFFVAKVLNSTGTFRISCVIAGNNITVLASSASMVGVFSLSISGGFIVYTSLTGVSYDLSVQALIYEVQ